MWANEVTTLWRYRNECIIIIIIIMPNVMAAMPNIGGALCSTTQSLADAQYWSAVQ